MKLVVIEGALKGREFAIDGYPTVIGRSSTDADIALAADPRISRRHCQLLEIAGRLHLEDLGSNNGTFVEGQKLIERTPIDEGTVFRIGDCDVRVDAGAVKSSSVDSGAESHVDPESLAAVHLSDGASTSSHSRTMDPTTVTMRPSEIVGEPNQDPSERTAKLQFNPVELERLRARLRVLHEVAEASTRQADLGQLFEVAADGILQATMASRAAVLLPDPEGNLMPVVLRTHGGGDVSVSRTIVERAVKDRMTVLVQDAMDDTELKSADSISIQQIRAALCVPLMFEGQVKAVIYVDARAPRVFSGEELELVTSIANQTAVALANAGLLAQLEQVSGKLKDAHRDRKNVFDAFRSFSRTG